MITNTEIGRRIRKARKLAGLTQGQLAKTIGLTGATISNLEKGKRDIDLRIISSIAEVIDKPLSYFYENRENQGSDEISDLAGQLDNLKNIYSRSESEKLSLEKKMDLLDIVYMNSSDAMVIVDMDGRILDCNKAFTVLFDLMDREVVGENIDILRIKLNFAFFIEILNMIREHGSWSGDLLGRTDDGKIKYLSLIGHSVLSKNKRSGAIMLVIRDFTEQKRMERLTKKNRAVYEQFFDNNPYYCYMVSPEGKIVHANKAALSACGYDKEDLIGRPVKVLYAEESLEKMERLLKQWQEKGVIEEEEMIIVTKNGDKKRVLLSVNTIKDSEGNIISSASVQKEV